MGPPGMVEGAAGLMVEGVWGSVGGGGAGALGVLVRAATLVEPAGAAVLLPDSPAALAAIVALHCGEPAIADSVLQRAAAAGVGGPLLMTRYGLLRAWTYLVRGRIAEATALLAAVDDQTAVPPGVVDGQAAVPPGVVDGGGTRRGRRLEPRDALFAAGLRVGLARRGGDSAGLAEAWRRAGEALVCHPVDLFTLLPLGEFAVAAARLGDQARLAPRLADAWALLAALGDPPLWASALHWSGVHAAIVVEDPAAAREHVDALATAAPLDRHSAVLHAAARCWLAVLDGQIDPDEVDTAASGLHDAGLGWDAARLAGQAAIRTTDRKAMVRLLDRARQLQGRQRSASSAATPTRPATAATRTDLAATPMAAGIGPAGPPTATGIDLAGPSTATGMDPAGPSAATGADMAGIPVWTASTGVATPTTFDDVVPAAVDGSPATTAGNLVVASPQAMEAAAAGSHARAAAASSMLAATADSALVADSGLSARELEVAELAAGGLTYKEIGGRLFISAKTVEHHMARMRRKLGCDTRGELLSRLRQLANAR